MDEPMTEEKVNKILEKYPELQQFSEKSNVIAELAEKAEKETDLSIMSDGFKAVLRMQDQLHAEMITWKSQEHNRNFSEMEKNCREWKGIAEKLKETLENERQESISVLDNICFLMLVDPRGTFENVILKQVERRKKTEDADGYGNWQWGLRFPLKARLRMACMLAFGKRRGAKC